MIRASELHAGRRGGRGFKDRCDLFELASRCLNGGEPLLALFFRSLEGLLETVDDAPEGVEDPRVCGHVDLLLLDVSVAAGFGDLSPISFASQHEDGGGSTTLVGAHLEHVFLAPVGFRDVLQDWLEPHGELVNRLGELVAKFPLLLEDTVGEGVRCHRQRIVVGAAGRTHFLHSLLLGLAGLPGNYSYIIA